MLNPISTQVLRLLLADPRLDPDEVDWAELRDAALANGVIVRLADAVAARGDGVPPRVRAAAARAAARTQRALAIADELGSRCEAMGLPHAFLRTVENYPDSGTVTVLVAAPHTTDVDRAILADVPAAPRSARNLGNRLAGSTRYSTVDGIAVRIRHGRLGRLGEHAQYARVLLGRAAKLRVGATALRAPAPEDRLLILAIEQAYTGSPVGIADLASTIPLFWTQTLDWDALFANALSIGMLEGVGAFLASVSAVHHQMFGRDIVDTGVLARFHGRSSHLRRLGAALEAGRWQSAARLSLRPIVAAVAGRRTRRAS